MVPHCGVAINGDNDAMLSQNHSMLVSWGISQKEKHAPLREYLNPFG